MSALIELGERVRVHWHLREQAWSVSKKGPNGWRVDRTEDGTQILYTKVVLKDVTFHVSENGRQRVLREQRKNVHAWMEGEILSASLLEDTASVPCGVQIKYNPYKWDSFYTDEYNDAIPTSVKSAEFASAGSTNGVLVPEWALELEVS